MQHVVDFEYFARDQEQDAERRVPHDDLDQLHGDLVEHEKEMQEQLGFATHAAYDHAERDAERDHAKYVHVLIVLEGPFLLQVAFAARAPNHARNIFCFRYKKMTI